MLTNREKGKQLEYRLAEVLKQIDPQTHITRASGGSVELFDVSNKYFAPECKNWNKKNCIIDHKIWKHLVTQLPVQSLRIPILVQENNEGKIFVSLLLEDFGEIIKKAYKEE